MLTPKSSTWAAHKRVAIPLGMSGACFALALGLMSALGIRINTSYSLPMGIYTRTGDGHTNLIEFCPEGHAAAESSERGYRTSGVCPDSAAPFLKPIVARPGDTVEMSARRYQRKWATGLPDGPRIRRTVMANRSGPGRADDIRWPMDLSGWRPHITEARTTAGTWDRFLHASFDHDPNRYGRSAGERGNSQMLQSFLTAIKRERWTVGSAVLAACIGIVAWHGIPES